jgi:hypothetical protein
LLGPLVSSLACDLRDLIDVKTRRDGLKI